MLLFQDVVIDGDKKRKPLNVPADALTTRCIDSGNIQ